MSILADNTVGDDCKSSKNLNANTFKNTDVVKVAVPKSFRFKTATEAAMA